MRLTTSYNFLTTGAIVKYHCNYCQEDIAGIRVKCADCSDFDLCLQCFACGAEIGNHKNSHSYQLISVIDSGYSKKPPEENMSCLD